MKPPVIRPARPGDAGDLARNWIGTARHYAELDSDAFQVPADVSARLERRGVGALLLRAAEAWGREQGMGYERRSIVFEKRLG
jgi:GNAT superfamily N-acetyltransferase